MKQYKFLVILVVIVLIGVPVALGGWKYLRTEKLEAKLATTEATLNPDEIKDLMNLIGKHVMLPDGEEPTVATVQDVERLRNQPFFAKAINGDKVLIFHKAQKAYLYRQSVDKVLDIAPLQIPSPSPTGTVAGATTATGSGIKITIINAGATQESVNSVMQSIKALIPLAVVETVTTTKVYSKSTIADLTGEFRDITATLSEELEIPLESFPGNETRPKTDAAIILAPRFTQSQSTQTQQRRVVITPQATQQPLSPTTSPQSNL